ncbi:MAG: hypothetical protein J7501_13920, partial [Bdellovibrio sp.]|nr:hypothetical protein [Bdellovibrio sp.]
MNKSFSVLVVFFPLILSAQPNSGPVGQLDQAQKKIKALSTPGSDCGVCNVTMTKDSSTDKLVCEDLFAASCLGSDGQSKYKDQEKALTAQINQSIKDARNKAAVELGFKDFNSAVKAKLKDAGIAINENPERFDNWLDSPWNMEGLVALN